jgi:phage FluMu gp28-like protein
MKDNLQEVAITKLQLLLVKLRDDPKLFLYNFCYTFDPQDKNEPIKKFPHKAYMDKIIDFLLKERLVLICKSRQMMLTWLIVLFNLWDAMFHVGRQIFFVSKKEDDANHLVRRAEFAFEHLPPYLRIKKISKYCYLGFPQMYSEIHGMSQNADALRMYTASTVFFDEMAFQPYARDAYQAIRPTIEAGGKFIGVSTPNGKNFFYNLLFDLE